MVLLASMAICLQASKISQFKRIFIHHYLLLTSSFQQVVLSGTLHGILWVPSKYQVNALKLQIKL